MLTLSPSYDPTALDAYTGSVAGQVYDADKQCEIMKGAGSYLCRVSDIITIISNTPLPPPKKGKIKNARTHERTHERTNELTN